MDVSDEILLANLQLSIDGQLTTAAAMMFHENPERWAHSAYIKIGYFEKSDADLIYQDEIHGPLIEQVDKDRFHFSTLSDALRFMSIHGLEAVSDEYMEKLQAAEAL